MIRLQNYKGNRIFIHDENGNDVACSTIASHNLNSMLITVNGIPDGLEIDRFVTVLILTSDSIHEYRGTVRRFLNTSLSTEIALFRGQIKEESRSAARYAVNTSARIQSPADESGSQTFPYPMDVNVVNLSSNGALIRTKPDCLPIGAVFDMHLPIGEKITTISCRIVRVSQTNPAEAEYGCEFLLVRS